MSRVRPHVAAALLICAFVILQPQASASSASAQYTPANAEWNQPVEPFRIAGNLYYVGASDVTSYAITTPDGIILIDTGFRETVPLIEASLKKLGFRFEDIRLVVTMHAHNDHAGGVAEIKARTKARFLSSPGDVPLFEQGGRGDFAFGDRFYYPPVKPDALLHDGEAVTLGGTQLTAHFTPGHTKGATSWTTTIHDGDHDYHVVFVSSLSTPDYQLVDNPKYPTLVQDLDASIAKLRALPCDIFLSEHGSQFDLTRRIAQRTADPAHNPFVDPAGYRALLDKAESNVHKLAAEQRAASKPGSKAAPKVKPTK
jgi:metallo-beta-lactamase class B